MKETSVHHLLLIRGRVTAPQPKQRRPPSPQPPPPAYPEDYQDVPRPDINSPACPERLTQEAPRRHPSQIPKPPHLAPFNLISKGGATLWRKGRDTRWTTLLPTADQDSVPIIPSLVNETWRHLNSFAWRSNSSFWSLPQVATQGIADATSRIPTDRGWDEASDCSSAS